MNNEDEEENLEEEKEGFRVLFSPLVRTDSERWKVEQRDCGNTNY